MASSGKVARDTWKQATRGSEAGQGLVRTGLYEVQVPPRETARANATGWNAIARPGASRSWGKAATRAERGSRRAAGAVTRRVSLGGGGCSSRALLVLRCVVMCAPPKAWSGRAGGETRDGDTRLHAPSHGAGGPWSGMRDPRGKEVRREKKKNWNKCRGGWVSRLGQILAYSWVFVVQEE